MTGATQSSGIFGRGGSGLLNPAGSKSLIVFVVLALAWIAGFSSRLFAVIRFESIIHEFDPWYVLLTHEVGVVITIFTFCLSVRPSTSRITRAFRDPYCPRGSLLTHLFCSFGVIFSGSYDLDISVFRFNYRSTAYMVKHGFYDFLNWFDERAWYPLGRIVGGTVYPGLMVTSGSIHYVLSQLNIPTNIRDICVFLAPLFRYKTYNYK